MPSLPRRIHRFEIPIDGHHLDLGGDILHAACRRRGYIDVWSYARDEGMAPMGRSFVVVGTGHPNPPGTTHAATAITPYGTLVWHILEQHGIRVEASGPLIAVGEESCKLAFEAKGRRVTDGTITINVSQDPVKVGREIGRAVRRARRDGI